MRTEPTTPHQLTQSMLQPSLPARKADAHKGDFGSVAILGGDTGMLGAVLLSARAALYSGAGRVYASMLCSDAPSVDICQPEIMLRSPMALARLTQLDCVVIGPGLGQTKLAVKWLTFWLRQKIPVLLDADALNLIAHHPHLASIVINRSAETVITPHPKEAARLLAETGEHVQQNRRESALKLARLFRATCVLKGAGSICAHYDGNWFINTSGNVGLASGGTGDVLSGLIGSLIAQGMNALDAAKLGVYVHGAAADALVKKGIGPVGLTASEVAIEIRDMINQLNKVN